MKVGYARISTISQNLEMQLDALKKEGCTKIFQEVISGNKVGREELDKCLSFLRPGDTLVVWSIDRLGRSQKDLINIMADLLKRGMSFISIQEKIDTNTPLGQIMFSLFSMLAEFERNRSLERTRAGMEAARLRGRLGGRRYKHNFKEREFIRDIHKSKKYTIKEICQIYKISQGTVYNYLDEKK
jgi:DNA invertase Pin-like site-specific DNA recombinase